MNENIFDVIVIGGGPAGLTSAIYVSRANLKTAVVAGDPPGGQLMWTSDVENFPGFPDGIMGPDLICNMRGQVAKFGSSVFDANVKEITGDFKNRFKLKLSGEITLEGRCLIICSGASAKWLNIESEQKLRGKGVSACAVCDGFFFKDKITAVVGGGDAALEDAIFLTKYSPKVYVFVRASKENLRAAPIMQTRSFDNPKIEFMFNSEVREVCGEQSVTGVKVFNNITNIETKIDLSGLFIAIGHDPSTTFLKGFIDLDDKGYIIVNQNTKASKEGVFVGGDVADYRYRQAVTAAGFGCMAALDAPKVPVGTNTFTMSFVKTILKNKSNILLFFILFFSFLLRIYGLGYSHFYGDETKVFYTDKTVSAANFFFDQRKGPVQFLVSWLTEKIIGSFDELYSRIPFALCGWLSIIVFYLVIKKLFNEKIALISTFLYAFNGFYIAFSRIVQYQSFLMLFGFLAILFALYFLDGKNSNKMAIVSSLMLALAHLTHYDALFFDIVIIFILVKKLSYDKSNVQKIIKYYLLPFFIIISLFYIPYLIKGYYYTNTYNYVARRLTGNEYAQNASWYTFWAYNPNILWAFLLVFITPFFFKKITWSRKLLLIWFLVPFIIFDYIILNPGTHIHNYLIPMIIIVSLGIYDVYLLIKTKIYKLLYLKLISIIFILIILTDFYSFVPGVNNGYPWKDSRAGFWNVSKINKRFHLFLYGFPYQRGWDQIRDYVKQKGGFRYIYTNDNEVVAKYYLNGIAYSPPGSNYLPQYYIHIENSQEFFDKDPDFIKNLNLNYTLEKEFFVNGVKTASIYKLIKK